jgi:hypothetical protein
MKLPAIVGKFAFLCDAWVVGSGAKPDVDFSTLRDWDILVPFPGWHIAAGFIPKTAVPNIFGGWKFISHDVELDVWPGDLHVYLRQGLVSAIWHPASGKRLMIHG